MPATPAPVPARAPASRRWVSLVVTLISFVLAFVTGAIVMVVADPEVLGKFAYFFNAPGDALGASWDKISTAYSALLRGSVGSWLAITETTAQAAPLICAGLGVALAFRAGLFNIGAQGQAIWGAIFGAWIGFTIKGLPWFIHIPIALALAMVFGALWGAIAGFLKAKTGAHEVIVTIMLNYIALYMLQFLLTTPMLQQPGRSDPISSVVEFSATMPRLAGTRLTLGFFIALAAAVAVWWLLERTTLGFRIRAVGLNPHAAATAGMSVSRTTIVAMAIAGSLAGLAGAQAVLTPTLLTGFPTQLSLGIVGTVGFDAITVALLGRSRPLGVVLAGLLFGALKAGGLTMAAEAQTPSDLTNLIQALIVLFVAAPAFVLWLVPGLREKRPGADITAKAATA
ncbi:ABC transporter permease [Tessaracoccus antarcticus]|uniref:ABC transporter permease n=2 Tax=Tessaracoccus antarcticus TaxID=2479848 RepID=A0A3M0G144_9ACTN|nr:ABC transporter permease [Tessaracoccus antarcticus]